MKRIKALSFIVITFFLFSGKSNAQEIQWKSLEEATQLHQLSPSKPIFIDIYTTWCHWCKVMDKETFTDSKVLEYINENYIPVKWEAQNDQAVTFYGKTYRKENTYHDLSYVLLEDQLMFPTYVILENQGDIKIRDYGYLEADEFLNWLQNIE